MSSKHKPSKALPPVPTSAQAVATAAAPSPAQPASANSTAKSTDAAATLQVFWDLAKEDARERAAACQRLLQGLQLEQAQFIKNGGAKQKIKSENAMEISDDEGGAESDDEEQKSSSSKLVPTVLSSSLCPSLSYALKRLTRGLASSRAGARQGFALALTEILASMPVVSTEDVLAIVADQVKLNSKANKQETRDYHLGRVFFALVLIRSNRVPTLTSDQLTNFVIEILDYAKQNLPIREVSYETVTQLIRHLPWSQYSAATKLVKYILKEFCGSSLENLSIEQIGLSLAMKEYYEEKGHSLPSNKSDEDGESKSGETEADKLVVSSSVRKLFSSKYLPVLHQAMFSAMQHYSISEKLHTTWSTLILHLWRTYPEEKFVKFWHENVEEALFGGSTAGLVNAPTPNSPHVAAQKSTSYQKKFIGFQLVNLVLTLLPKVYQPKSQATAAAGSLLAATDLNQVVSIIFSSKNFLRTFINHLSSSKNILHSSAQFIKRSILTFAQAQPSSILTIIAHLENVENGGHPRFDSRTHSNLIVKLLEGLNESGVLEYVEKLIQTFLHAQPTIISEEKKEVELAQPTPSKKKKDSKAAAVAPTTAAAISSVDSTELAQQGLDSSRDFVIEQLFLLSRNKNVPQGNGEWLKRSLSFLFYFGFFTSSAAASKSAPFPNPTHPISEKTRTLMSDKLFHLLNELLPHPPVTKRPTKGEDKKKGDKKSKKADDESEDESEEEEEEGKGDETTSGIAALTSFHQLFATTTKESEAPWVLQLHQLWTTWTSGKKSTITLLQPLTSDESTIRDQTLEYIDTLRKKYSAKLSSVDAITSLTDGDKTLLAQLRALQLLLSHLALLLLRSEDREFATPLLQDLKEGSNDLFVEKKPAKKSKKATVAEESDKPPFINVLLDILFALLIRPSTLFRDIARSTFGAFITELNEEGLDELLEILRRKERIGGKNADEDEDEDSDNFPSEDDESDEEEKKTKNGKKNSQKNEKVDKKGEKDEKKALDPVPKSKKKQSALDEEAAKNAAKYAKYAAKSTDDSDSDGDEEMIDINGLNTVFGESDPEDEEDENLVVNGALDSYDSHLSNIVRLRNERKTIHKETVQQSLHFKLRVCDLLEVFLKQQHESPLVLRMFIPMLLAIDAARSSKDTLQLQQRLTTLYKKLVGIKSHPRVDTPEKQANVKELMTTLMSRAVKTENRETLGLTNLGLIYLAKLLIPHEVKDQIEGAIAATSAPTVSSTSKKSKSSAAAASPASEAISFVLQLYRTSLIAYFNVRRGNCLNTKFFTDFFQAFPGLAWTFLDDLSQLARAKLPQELQDKKLKSSSDLYASTVFRRIECFTLLSTILNNRRMLKENHVLEKFQPSLPTLLEAIRSSIIATTLPPPVKVEGEKNDDDESDKEAAESDADSDDEKEEVNDKKSNATDADDDDDTKKKKLAEYLERKKARELKKAREKKKRRLAKQKAAAKALAAASTKEDPAVTKAKQEQESLKTNIHRLKMVFKFANQLSTTFNDTNMQPLTSTLTALPATLATPLKSAIHTFLITAKIDPTKVALKIDQSLLNKVNPNQIKKEQPKSNKDKSNSNKDKKKQGNSNGTNSNKKSSPASSASTPTSEPIKKKSNNRNLIPSSVSSSTSSTTTTSTTDSQTKDSKKRSASDSADSNGHAEKKQKMTDSSSPSTKKSPSLPPAASPKPIKESKKHKLGGGDEEEKKSKKSKQ